MSARQLARGSVRAASAVLTIAALLVAGCGVQPQTGGSAATRTPGLPAPHLPTPGGSTPVMTNIVITTDQQSYKPGDTIHVTITNHTATPIFATSGKASCTVVEAQIKDGTGLANRPDRALRRRHDGRTRPDRAQGQPQRQHHRKVRARVGNVSPGAELLHVYHSSAPGRRIAQRRAARGRAQAPAEIQPADDGLLAGIHCRIG